MSDLTVVIPTHDRLQWLQEALASVAENGRPADVVVVADNCTDGTVEWLAANQVDYRVTSTGNPAQVRNAGLSQVRSEFVAFLDDDDVWIPGHAARAVDALKADPSLAFVWGRVQMTDVWLNPIGGALPALTEFPEPAELWEHPIQIGAVVFRTDLVRESGGFPEHLRFYEDQPVLVRLSTRHGCRGLAHLAVLFRQRPKTFDDALVRATARKDYIRAGAIVKSCGNWSRSRWARAERAHRRMLVWNFLHDAAFLWGGGMWSRGARAAAHAFQESPFRCATAVTRHFPQLRHAWLEGRSFAARLDDA